MACARSDFQPASVIGQSWMTAWSSETLPLASPRCRVVPAPLSATKLRLFAWPPVAATGSAPAPGSCSIGVPPVELAYPLRLIDSGSGAGSLGAIDGGPSTKVVGGAVVSVNIDGAELSAGSGAAKPSIVASVVVVVDDGTVVVGAAETGAAATSETGANGWSLPRSSG